MLQETIEIPDLSFLDDNQRDHILKVLKRDEELRKKHTQKLDKLKAEIKKIEQNSIDVPKSHIDSTRLCVRCRSEFTTFFNPAVKCSMCGFRVCQNCRVYIDVKTQEPSEAKYSIFMAISDSISDSKYKWLCILCSRIRQLMKETGDWMYISKSDLNQTGKSNSSRTSLGSQRSICGAHIVQMSLFPSQKDAFLNGLATKRSASNNKINENKNTSTKRSNENTYQDEDKTISLRKIVDSRDKAPVENLITKFKDTKLKIILNNEDSSKTSKEKTVQNSHNTPKTNTKRNYKGLLLDDNVTDFASVTSSEMDDRSEFGENNFDLSKKNENIKFPETINEVNSPVEKSKNENFDELLKQANSINNISSRWKNALIALTRREPNNDSLQMDVVNVNKKESSPAPSQSSRAAKTNLDTKPVPIANNTSTPITKSPAPSRATTNAETNPESDVDAIFAENGPLIESSKTMPENHLNTMSSNNNYDTELKVKGKIYLQLSFNKLTSNLNVVVIRCEGLACGNSKKKTSDPYVKLYLLPDKNKSNKRKTTTKKNTLDPVYNETLRYTVPANKLDTYTLLVSVWHHSVGHNKFLGEVKIRIYEEELKKLDSIVQTFTLKQHYSTKSELVFDLQYDNGNKKDKKGILQVTIRNALNLEPRKFNGLTDSYVEAYLLPSRSKSTKQKSRVIKNNLYPEYDASFAWTNLSIEDLKDRSLELLVWSQDFLQSNQLIGGIRLNCGTNLYKGKIVSWMDANANERAIWSQLIDNSSNLVSAQIELRNEITLHND